MKRLALLILLILAFVLSGCVVSVSWIKGNNNSTTTSTTVGLKSAMSDTRTGDEEDPAVLEDGDDVSRSLGPVESLSSESLSSRVVFGPWPDDAPVDLEELGYE